MNKLTMLQQAVCNGSAPVSFSALACKQCATKIEKANGIATGRLKVLDVSPEEAKKVIELISTTDGIIFQPWSDDEKVPSGRVVFPQSIGHVNLTASELKNGAKETVKSSENRSDGNLIPLDGILIPPKRAR